MMEEQPPIQEIAPKRGRRRKKLLYKLIREQMEFYFSDCNISKDRFIAQQIEKDPFIPLSVFLQFNKIRRLTNKDCELRKAISFSELLELSQDELKVKRKTPIRAKENEDECTIYVERLPVETEHDWLKSVFSKFGPVDYVSIPRYKHNKIIKGFAFIEYSTPECAQRVLEYCEAIGCKLPTTMLPDQLASITSFKTENCDKEQNILSHFTANENEMRKDNENSNNNKVQEMKIKQEIEMEENEELDAIENESMEGKADITFIINETTIDKDDTTKGKKDVTKSKKEKTRKRNLEENNESSNENKDEEVNENKKRKIENNKELSEDDMKTDEVEDEAESKTDGTEGKTKRKRKRKKKCISEILQYGLRVLPKRDWKQLRNKYLNLQRQKMKSLKQHLNRNRFGNTQNNMDVGNESTSENNYKESKPRFEFTPGVIVHIVWPDVISEIKKIKNDINSQPNIQYIDVKQGNSEGYIRFSDNISAINFCETENINANKYILDGPAEREYWDSIIQHRDEKFKTETKKKQRGRDKLLKKAEKALGKHIKFEAE